LCCWAVKPGSARHRWSSSSVAWLRTTLRILEDACDALSTPRPLGPLADIATLVGGELERQLGSGAARDAVFGALMGELVRGPGVILMVFEDVHWADEATLDLLRCLALLPCIARLVATHCS
jgi:hypothetical protein